MKDNGESTQLVMDGYLSNDELKANLPSDVDSSKVNSYGLKMCDFVDPSTVNCNTYGESVAPSWNKSIVEPTIENWLNSKMTEYGLTKENELKGMAFTDGKETINSYVRLPLYDEILAINKTCDDGTNSPYCADTGYYMFTSYSYWLTTVDTTRKCEYYGFNYYTNSDDGIGGAPYSNFSSNNAKIRPVITVNEK